jgi:hypothetical protein
MPWPRAPADLAGACGDYAGPAACIRGRTPWPRLPARTRADVPRAPTGRPPPPRGGAGGAQRRRAPGRVSRITRMCSAGASPAGVTARHPVAWMAGGRGTNLLKPIDEAVRRTVSESPGRNESERGCGLESAELRRPRVCQGPEGCRSRRSLADAAASLRRGGSDGTVTRTHQATGEALLVPPRKGRSRVDPITSAPGKRVTDERVADGPIVATRRGNARGAKGPCWSVVPPPTRKAGVS